MKMCSNRRLNFRSVQRHSGYKIHSQFVTFVLFWMQLALLLNTVRNYPCQAYFGTYSVLNKKLILGVRNLVNSFHLKYKCGLLCLY